jgi:hypothetical protein
LNAAKKQWSLAVAWFRRSSKILGLTMSSATEKHLTRVGWGAGITIGREGTTTLALPQLLADGCLSSAVLDLMAECTQVEASYNGPTQVFVCGTVFADKVTQLGITKEGLPDWFLDRFVHPVKMNRCKKLYFPMYWPKHKHWVSVKIDFAARRVFIGR